MAKIPCNESTKDIIANGVTQRLRLTMSNSVNNTLIFKSTFDSAHLIVFPKDEKMNELLPSEKEFLVTEFRLRF